MDEQVTNDLFLEFGAILANEIKKSIKPQLNERFEPKMFQKDSNLTILSNTLSNSPNNPQKVSLISL